MATKITIDLNDTLAERAKKYAEEQGRSLSSLVESFLANITNPVQNPTGNIKVEDSEVVKRILEGNEPVPDNVKNLVGVLKGMSEEDAENARWEHLKEKHSL